jgi:hypothetical protein
MINEHAEEMKRVNAVFAQLTLDKEQAIQRENAAMHQAFVAQSQFQELYGILCQWQPDLGIAIQQWNEAWNENNHLRSQVIAMNIVNGALHGELQHF